MTRLAAALLALVFVASCQPTDDFAPIVMTDAERAACAASGGVVGGGLSGESCLTRNSDAGQSCSRASDCQGECVTTAPDTPGGMCAEVSPLFGCYTSLDDNGEPSTLCVD